MTYKMPILHFNAELTRGCNQSCAGCFNYSGRRLPNELDTPQRISAIDIMKAAGARTALYTGGEIMTRDDVFQILKASMDRGFETSILSNGCRINERLAEEEKEVLRWLRRAQISLNSGDPEYHNRTRGSDWAFATARDAIDYLMSEGIPVEISCTVFPKQEEHLKGVAKIAYETGSKVIIRPFIDRRAQEVRQADAIKREKADIENMFGIVFVEDFARYVPVLGKNHDRITSRDGFVTIDPQGKLRSLGIPVSDIAV